MNKDNSQKGNSKAVSGAVEVVGAVGGVGATASGKVRLRVPDRESEREVVFRCEDLIPKRHEARLVWAVVQGLDLSALEAKVKAREGVAGRAATDPRLLVALWAYAATQGVGSARELARRCRPVGGSDPYKWMCGGVTVNHHLLSDFRVGHAEVLDELLTQVVATLADKGLVRVWRIAQDGTRVRACAGADTFRREERLGKLLEEAKAHVEELKALLEDPASSAGLSARKKAARRRAARERRERLEAAVAQLPELKAKQEEAARKAGNGKRGEAIRAKQPRVSTTDAEARVMKMPDGGFRPAVNVQLAVDTESRAVVGVEVSSEGSDSAGLSEPMRRQVEARCGGEDEGRKVRQQLLDGGYLRTRDLERAHQAGVELLMPPKPARSPGRRGKELEPKAGDSEAVLAWKARMSSEEGKAAYKLRASTVETVNADLKAHRGLVQMTVRGLKKAKCVVLWCALAYNLLHFAPALCAAAA